MNSKLFDDTSTTDDVLKGIDLSGKRVLITGVSAGLGVETARALAAHGAQVVGAVRDVAKAKQATSHIPGIELVELDLTSLASVRACTDALVKEGRSFDLVIGNAGVMATPFGRTKDGFETQFGTNHLGHFLFINRLLPLLKKGSRVIVLSSAGHRYSDADLDDPNFERTEYTPMAAYGRSKTANILFAVEFDRRHRAQGIRAAAVHPGGIKTELTRHIGDEGIEKTIAMINEKARAEGLPEFRWKSIPQGAATTVWAAAKASAEEIGGRYCEDCHVAEMVDSLDPAIRHGVRPYATDGVRAKQLWTLSEKMVGETFEAVIEPAR